MPKTVIIRQTWRCMVCFAVGCWSCQWDNNSLEGTTCAHCKVGIIQLEMRPEYCGTMAIIGDEDIELEIEERDETLHRGRRQGEIDAQVTAMDAGGEFATALKRDTFRSTQRMILENRIAALKRQPRSALSDPTYSPAGYFLATPTQVMDYRARRKDDIVRAIAEARKREHKPT